MRRAATKDHEQLVDLELFSEPPSDVARPATRVECLANRIMALRETRCEVHQHYLCSRCAGDWITAHTDAATADLRRQRGCRADAGRLP